MEFPGNCPCNLILNFQKKKKSSQWFLFFKKQVFSTFSFNSKIPNMLYMPPSLFLLLLDQSCYRGEFILFNLLILRERETINLLSTYLCPYMCSDQGSNSQAWHMGQCSNQLRYPVRARKSLKKIFCGFFLLKFLHFPLISTHLYFPST